MSFSVIRNGTGSPVGDAGLVAAGMDLARHPDPDRLAAQFERRRQPFQIEQAEPVGQRRAFVRLGLDHLLAGMLPTSWARNGARKLGGHAVSPNATRGQLGAAVPPSWPARPRASRHHPGHRIVDRPVSPRHRLRRNASASAASSPRASR